MSLGLCGRIVIPGSLYSQETAIGFMKKNIMVVNKLAAFIIFSYLGLFSGGCENSPEPKKTKGSISGIVRSKNSGSALVNHRAYIFLQDSLIATSDVDGSYAISTVEEGSYLLTCSSLGYRDTTEAVQARGGKSATHDFYLIPDSSTGRVYGEFQDMGIFSDSLLSKPYLKDWDAKQIYDGVTGATIQSRTLMYHVPPREVFLGDSLVAISDDWGQFWLEIQCGTYPLTGRCENYNDVTLVVKVLPDSRIYVNFYLQREMASM